MMKRIWIVCALLALLLAACGGEAKMPEQLPETAPANLEVERETPPAEDAHEHQPAETPQTVENPVSGYCGNTVTTVRGWNDGEEEGVSFWGGDSVTLTDILINLEYDPETVCRCLPEYRVDTEFGDGYGMNLTEAYARCGAGQAPLTAEQAETIQDIILRNCA